jgi:aminoglycoside phosphotransferase (APT) family kinase protein
VTLGGDPTAPAWVAAACDGAVAAARRARWGFRHETWLVDLVDGLRVVVQRRADGSDPLAAHARAKRGRVRGTAIDVPEPVSVQRIGDRTVVVFPFVEGVVAAELLTTDEGAVTAGRACGEVAARLAAIDPTGLRLPGTWASGRALLAAVPEWVAALEPGSAGGARERSARTAQRAAREIDAAGPCFAHGDLAPVNVLVRDGRPAAVLDLDRARPAHPRYDAAWFGWVVGFHHPGVAGAAWSAFARASGLGERPVDDVAWLWPLLLLERAAGAQDDAERMLWSDRLSATLAG